MAGKKLERSGLLLLGIMKIFSGTDTKASTLSSYLHSNNPAVGNSSAELTHHSIPPLFEYSFLEMWPPALNIYYIEGADKMKGIAKLPDSMDTEVAYIEGKGLSQPINAQINANISPACFDGEYCEENMLNKKVISRLYEVADGNDILRGTYDCWNMTESGQSISLTVKNGLSHKWITSFYNTNTADFDNNGTVDFKDYAILSDGFGGNEGNYLTDISGPKGISDGFVDIYDLDKFCDNWLN